MVGMKLDQIRDRNRRVDFARLSDREYKVLEQKLRKKLYRRGFLLRKNAETRTYMIVDDCERLVDGFDYGFDLEAVQTYVDRLIAKSLRANIKMP
jgi:hypothetical protein